MLKVVTIGGKKEVVKDLLGSTQRQNASLALITDQNGQNTRVDNLTEHYMSSVSDVLNLLMTANEANMAVEDGEDPGHSIFLLTVHCGQCIGRVKFAQLSQDAEGEGLNVWTRCMNEIGEIQEPSVLKSKLTLILQDIFFQT